MNVLSLFDGMSCGQLALKKLGIPVNDYYASEIDKHAIKVSSTKFPNTHHLGSVTEVQPWHLPQIDLLIGGSPCQGFSFAGKQLNFNDPRSALFFEFVRLLKQCQPKYFLLENVMMKKEYQDVISQHLGCEPIKINSNLVSAQNRKRLYWTNIPDVAQPEDKGILLRDILQEGVDEKYYLTEKAINYMNQPGTKGWDRGAFTNDVSNEKAGCITANHSKGVPYNVLTNNAICVAMRGRNSDDPNLHTEQKIEPRGDGKTNSLTTVQKDNLVMSQLNPRQLANYKNDDEKANTFLSTSYKGSQANGMTLTGNSRIRRLTPIEVCRLQTVPDDYFFHDGKQIVSDTQIYRMIGNGWTVDVIAHIFKGLLQ